MKKSQKYLHHLPKHHKITLPSLPQVPYKYLINSVWLRGNGTCWYNRACQMTSPWKCKKHLWRLQWRSPQQMSLFLVCELWRDTDERRIDHFSKQKSYAKPMNCRFTRLGGFSQKISRIWVGVQKVSAPS
jgi:hypothetical protein